jgi:hypothetical protein
LAASSTHATERLAVDTGGAKLDAVEHRVFGLAHVRCAEAQLRVRRAPWLFPHRAEIAAAVVALVGFDLALDSVDDVVEVGLLRRADQ